MSLQRRLLIYLLICAPVVWGVALFVSIQQTRYEVNEIYDGELIRLARQVQSTLRSELRSNRPAPSFEDPPPRLTTEHGEADSRDFALAVWDAQGELLMNDREGVQLPRLSGAAGFVDSTLDGKPWRVYYLQSTTGAWLVAAGQRTKERNELVRALTTSQSVPWLLVLPALLLAMTWAVRRAMAPVHHLAAELQGRHANDLQRIPDDLAPSELKPLVVAMNGLFGRIEETLDRERRFTADAAHELRTPLAALRAQWDVVRRSSSDAERQPAEARLGSSLDRLDRLVTQMLALSRLDSTLQSPQALPNATEVHWPNVVEQAMSDCLAMAGRRGIELSCEWPEQGDAMPLTGDENLLTVLLRNLLDNAVRYAPSGTLVTLRFAHDRLEVENDGDALTGEQLARMGERFHRRDGQNEFGSGLGVSIVQRIAAIHALAVDFGTRDDGRGVKVVLRRALSAT